MLENVEYTGVWFLPGKQENLVTGTLKFNQEEGITLDLLGSFEQFGFEVYKYSTILGIASGKYITLRNCVQIESNISFPGIETTKFTSSYMFVGSHLESKHDEIFRKINVKYHNLDEWIGISGIQEHYNSQDNTILISYLLPESKILFNNDQLKISINFSSHLKGNLLTERTILHNTYFEIYSENGITLEYFLDLSYKLQNLITLALGSSSYPTMIEMEHEDKNVKMFFKLPFISNAPKKVNVDNMLIRFSDLYESNPNFLHNWLERSELLKPVVDAYFGTIYHEQMYLEQKMLRLVQGLESYHRRTIRNEEIPQDEHEKRVQLILDSVEHEQYKEWLKDRLAYSNEPNLRKRLNEIWNLNKKILGSFLNRKTREYYIDKTVVTRNYHVHYNESLSEKALKGYDLYKLTVLLQILLKICFMKELGITDEKIVNLIQKNTNFQHQLSLVRIN